jgi:arabinan endo-1,5-alpha-L-arabinosidase
MELNHDQPVWPGEFADPFVLKWQGEYYAYGTSGLIHQGRRFPILHSRNFRDWQHIGNALEPLPGLEDGNYWAPEVAAHNGKFYMYFSAGQRTADETHRLHVAIADQPGGPFQTANVLLPGEGFSIDAHPFRDPRDGRWVLFFAKDFFDERVGTGLAAVPLSDDLRHPAGPVTTILRPSADWQIYERNRTIYRQSWAAWHTVEGPFVVWHEGRYYCFYSGGAWHSADYGVGYGVADQVLGPYHDEWGHAGPAVLQAIPDRLLGPGHMSVVPGPDDQTLYMAYHAWDQARTARRMYLTPLVWTAAGPRSGPASTIEGQ